VHAQLRVRHLQTAHKLLELLGEAVEVVALALEGENGGLLLR
jgi:hypothetical protein